MGKIRWMQEGPFGLMVHFLRHLQPKEGNPIADWNEMVNGFPVERFCQEVQETGAKWLIFTIGQNNGYYCSPNPVLESLLAGRCSERDLLLELSRNLKKRDIRLIAYLPSEVDSADEELRAAFGWDIHPRDKSVFQERYMAVIWSWAERLGEDLDGWWFDGCYDASKMKFLRTRDWDNSRFDYAAWASATKAGNPNAVVALNPGADAMGYAFREQDYLAGEVNDLKRLPDGPLVDGLQWHALTWIDCFWMHAERPGPIAPPRFTDDELYEYVAACRRQGGGVTLNIGIYQDGTMAEQSLAQLRRISGRLI
jgi:hypothetical protein